MLIVLAALSEGRAKARDTKRLEDLHNFEIGLALYYDKHGFYPCGDSNDTATRYDLTTGFPAANVGTLDTNGSCEAGGGPTNMGFLNGNNGPSVENPNWANSYCVVPPFSFPDGGIGGLYMESLLPTNCPKDPVNKYSATASDNQLYVYQVSRDRQQYLLATYLESNQNKMANDGGQCSDAYEIGPLKGIAKPVWTGTGANHATPCPP